MDNKQVVLTGLGGVENYKIHLNEIPPPSETEVRIRITATGIAFADVLMRKGLYPGTPKVPFVQGYDIIGVVESQGASCKKNWIGKKVAALIQWGGYSQYINLDEKVLVEVPEGLDDGECLCLVLNYVTAYQMIHREIGLVKGQSLLVAGAAGGVGTAILQLSQILGVKVIGLASKNKHHLVEALSGIPVDYKRDDVSGAVLEIVPDGVDAFLEIRGGAGFNQSFKLLKKGGTGVVYGLMDVGSPFQAVSMFTKFWFQNTFSSKSVKFYSIMSKYKKSFGHFHDDLTALFTLLKEGKIKPVVAKRIGLEEVAEAHRDFEKHSFTGKIIIEPQS